MLGRDDEVIRLQLVLSLPAKYRMQRGSAEYEVCFELNGGQISETKLNLPRTCGPSLEREIFALRGVRSVLTGDLLN